MKTLVLSLLLLPWILNSQAAEHKEYILSNLSSLLRSYSSVDFTRDSEEAIDQTKYNCAIKMNEFNREQSSVLSDLFSRFKSHEISEDSLLRKVLDIRFRNINFFQRHQGFKLHRKNDPLRNMIQGGEKLTITAGSIHIENEMDLVGDYVKFITTSKGGSHNIRFISKKEEEIYKLFGEWIPEYESSKQIEVRESFASLVNDNMYVLTQMILGIYSLRSPSYFSDDTYDFIKASQSLWPFLEQVAKGADPFLLDDETSVFENKELLKEYEYYTICLLNISGKNEPLKGLGCTDKDFIKVYGPLKDSGIIEGDWSLPALPKQLEELSNPKVGNWSLPVLPSQSEALRKPRIGANEKMKKRNKKSSHQETRLENESQAKSLPTASSQVLLNKDLLKKDLELVVNKPKSLQVNEIIDEGTLNEILPSATEAAASTASIGAVSSSPQHIFASWNRKLHSQRTLQAIPISTEPISNSHLKVLQAIFEGTSKVSYRNFESLWLHLNGENSIKSSKKGTSHRRLLNSEGKIVGGTFALNGGKRQYSSHHLKELRDALTLIGYGQNYLSS